MGNYDYQDTKNKKFKYPLKIYLDTDNTVVVMYTGVLCSDNFNLQNSTCIVSKDYFYNKINDLKNKKTATIVDGDLSIRIDIFNNECNVYVNTKNASAKSVEKDLGFAEWLLTIDLRKCKRIKALIPISIESSNIFEYGAILDISETGFKIAANNRLNKDEKISISIFDREFPASNIKCIIRHESMKKDKYVYGIEIEEASNEALFMIKEIIERNEKKTEK